MKVSEAFKEIKGLLDGQNEYNLTGKQIEALETSLKALSTIELFAIVANKNS